jgi:DNA-binding MarR family transcriptional regulator
MSSEIDKRTPFVGASMRVVWQWVWAQNFEAVTRAGYDDLNPAHVSLFRYPTLEGCGLTEIAQRMQITKQSVHELIGHLEARGYLVREPDPTNRRARLVRLTTKGHELELVIRAAAKDAEDHIAAILGQLRFTQLQKALAVLVQEINQ